MDIQYPDNHDIMIITMSKLTDNTIIIGKRYHDYRDYCNIVQLTDAPSLSDYNPDHIGTLTHHVPQTAPVQKDGMCFYPKA
jgi:hypothetical protein